MDKGGECGDGVDFGTDGWLGGCWDIIKTQPGQTSINNNRLSLFSW